MRDIYIDFESYYDRQFSLSKLTTAEYILGQPFDCYMLSFRIDRGPVHTIDGVHEVRQVVDMIPWHEFRVIAHHIHFDAAVLAWYFRKRPAMWGCSLAAARKAHPEWPRHSLKACSERLGLEAKGDTIHKLAGIRWSSAPDWLKQETRAYCTRDTYNGSEVWYRCAGEDLISGAEGRYLDYTVRMWTEPTLMIDPLLLLEHQVKLNAALEAKIAEARDKFGITEAILKSDVKLFAKCSELGLDPPLKPSKSDPTILKPAFAKSDEEFVEWEMSDDPVKQAIVAARLGIKSTIEASRTKRLLDMSKVTGGVLPVPLVYGNTNTWRLAGGEKLNLQNLPSRVGEPTLRRAIHAPAGCRIVAVDASQIECRLNAWWSDETLLLDAFRHKRDPYCEFATGMFQRLITKADKIERQIGKVAVLSCGYQAWIAAFERMLFANRVTPPPGMSLYDIATKAVLHYRRTFSRIVINWKLAGQMLQLMVAGGQGRIGPVVFERDGITLPSGHQIIYPDLRIDMMDGEAVTTYERRGRRKKVYSGLVVENVVQAMARDHIMEAWDRLVQAHDLPPMALQEHDALAMVVPEPRADEVAHLFREAVATSPLWASDAPLGAEAGHAVRYGDIVKT